MANPKITLTGRVGVNPEAMGTGARFRMVTQDRIKNLTGEWEDRDTSWWTIKSWKNTAEGVKSVIRKGQEVTVVGTIKENVWVSDDGQKRTTYDIVAESVAITAHSLSKPVAVSATNNAESNSVDMANPWGDEPQS